MRHISYQVAINILNKILTMIDNIYPIEHKKRNKTIRCMIFFQNFKRDSAKK